MDGARAEAGICHDIYAACSQLKRTLETTPHPELLTGILPTPDPTVIPFAATRTA